MTQPNERKRGPREVTMGVCHHVDVKNCVDAPLVPQSSGDKIVRQSLARPRDKLYAYRARNGKTRFRNE